MTRTISIPASLASVVWVGLAGCASDEISPGEMAAIWSRISATTGSPPWHPPEPSAVQPTAAGPTPPQNVSPVSREWAPIDLPTALRLVGENNLTVRLAAETVEEFRGQEVQSLSRFLPSLIPQYTFFSHGGRDQNRRGDVFDSDYNANRAWNRTELSLNPGRAFFETLQAREVRRAAGYGSERTGNDAGLSAALQFFDLVRALRTVAIAEDLQRQTRELVRVNRDRVEKGVGLRVDLTRAEARLAEADQFVQETTTAFQVASIRLANTLQLATDVTLFPADPTVAPVEFFGPDATLDELLSSAVANHPALKEQALLVSAAEKAKAAAVWEPLLPRVFLQANNGGFFNESSGIGGFQDYAVGVGWQIEGLAFANAGRIRSAESRLRQSALRAEDVRQRLLAEVTAAHRQVRLQRGLIATAAQQVKAAEESFRLAEDRLRGGTGLLLDVLDAQAQLLRARVNQLSAVVEFDKAQYRLFNAVGNRAKPSAR